VASFVSVYAAPIGLVDRSRAFHRTNVASNVSASPRRDEVRDLRGGLQQPVYVLLYYAIRVRYALVLPQMLQPRFNGKRLYKSSGLCHILENAPCICAVAPAFASELVHRHQEHLALPMAYVVFDRH